MEGGFLLAEMTDARVLVKFPTMIHLQQIILITEGGNEFKCQTFECSDVTPAEIIIWSMHVRFVSPIVISYSHLDRI